LRQGLLVGLRLGLLVGLRQGLLVGLLQGLLRLHLELLVGEGLGLLRLGLLVGLWLGLGLLVGVGLGLGLLVGVGLGLLQLELLVDMRLGLSRKRGMPCRCRRGRLRLGLLLLLLLAPRRCSCPVVCEVLDVHNSVLLDPRSNLHTRTETVERVRYHANGKTKGKQFKKQTPASINWLRVLLALPLRFFHAGKAAPFFQSYDRHQTNESSCREGTLERDTRTPEMTELRCWNAAWPLSPGGVLTLAISPFWKTE